MSAYRNAPSAGFADTSPNVPSLLREETGDQL